MTNTTDEKATTTVEIELEIEEIEEVIAPKLSANHNQTCLSA